MILRYIFVVCGILVFTLSGCSEQEMTKKPNHVGNAEFQVQKWEGDLSKQDILFVDALHLSMDTVQSMITELETVLQEMEGQDEYHEAEEMMKEAKQEILYHWNRIHNEYKPEHPELKRIKEYYEGLLTGYHEGLMTELEGMETGDPMKMKLGYEKTGDSAEALARFIEEMGAVFSNMKAR